MPDAIARIVAKLLAKNPVERYATADEALAELENVRVARDAALESGEMGIVTIAHGDATTPLPTIIDADEDEPSLSPLRRIVKDYYTICDSYYQAIRTATPDKIEAIDMGRRGVHNEGSRILMERLKGKVAIDIDTARRLFTLICVLHWKG